MFTRLLHQSDTAAQTHAADKSSRTGQAEAPREVGRYRIIELLGRGNMGTVYHAMDPLIDRAVALKLIDRSRLNGATHLFETLFRTEVQAIGRLEHPNIVTIFDAELGESQAYFAMEYIKGQTLKELLDAGIRLPVDRVREIVSEVAEGLYHAHQHGIVHRDIKPANIMVGQNGSVKIMDFGIALDAHAQAAQTGAVVGSPYYMAPEQFRGVPLDHRVDIYALGAVLYELLTGTQAFQAESYEDLRAQILERDPRPPTELNNSLNRNFDRIIARAMQKSPEARYQNVREFAQDVRQAGKSELNWSKTQHLRNALPVGSMLDKLKKTVWLFQGLRTDEIVEFLQQADKTMAYPGQQIIREGRPGEYVYILLSGNVEVVKQADKLGHGHKLAMLEPGQCFGEMSLVEQNLYSATVRAMNQCTLLRVSQSDFWKMPDISAKLYKNIAALLSSRLRQSNELLSIDMRRE